MTTTDRLVCALSLAPSRAPCGRERERTRGGRSSSTARRPAGSEREQALLLSFRDVVNVPQTELDALRSAPNWPARVEAVHTVVCEERARKAYEFDAATFEEVTMPTLLLVGSETPPFLSQATEALDDALPNSRIVIMEGQVHAAMNTAPELFVDEVLAFLQGLRKR